MFYLHSLLTGILECGWIAYGAVHSMPLWQILCYPLAYHLGNLFPKPFSLSRPILRGIGVLGAVTASVTFYRGLPKGAVFILTCITLMCLSTVIQSVRSEMKADGNRLLKRIFRVCGFMLAPTAVYMPSVILLISSVPALMLVKNYAGRCGVIPMKKQGGFSAVMVFHQLHYFFYAHITLAGISLRIGERGAVIGALLFCGTWITYMSVEPVMSRLTPKLYPVFYTGHIGITVILLTMSLVNVSAVFVILWLVTGLGGGAVYTIPGIAESKGVYCKASMTVAENIGHTAGLMTAVAVSAVFGDVSPKIMLIFGAASAVIAVLLMAANTPKEVTYESVSH